MEASCSVPTPPSAASPALRPSSSSSTSTMPAAYPFVILVFDGRFTTYACLKRLDQEGIFFVTPRILLAKRWVLHETLFQVLQLRHSLTVFIRSLAVANPRRGVRREVLANTCRTTTRQPVAVTSMPWRSRTATWSATPRAFPPDA